MTTPANLADRVLRNDPELQHLYLSSDTPNAEELAQALTTSRNNQLQHVYFRNFKLGTPLSLLLRAIGHVRNLQKIFFRYQLVCECTKMLMNTPYFDCLLVHL